MNIYNRTTHTLFKFIDCSKSTLFKDIKINSSRYCYLFPQKVRTWNGNNIQSVEYFILFWRIEKFYNIERYKRN